MIPKSNLLVAAFLQGHSIGTDERSRQQIETFDVVQIGNHSEDRFGS
jgi:hypothetical protein